ncbi:MAG: glycosyltransferase family 2 protein [Thermomicrobiales bacterium]|nr:MAG: glycosyltransferase family 2 protein [Thermomicrobiales bacterium]
MVEIMALVCVALIGYTYVGYPVLAALLGLFADRRVSKDSVSRSVVVVISAFNEERDIEATVRNKLGQDYPPEMLEVVVVSDESTDRTDQIVRTLVLEFPGRVRLIRQSPRQGKTQALNLAISQLTCDIVVFSDANSIYEKGAIRALVSNFADPTVGYVTGRMVYVDNVGSVVGKGSDSYIGYENCLRSFETRLGSIVGADGGVDAVRRVFYRPMRADQLPDFVLPLSVVEQGKRVVFEPAAVVFEHSLSSASDEFRMRVRVSLRAMWALYDKRSLLNPTRYRLYSWQLLSHKVLRYLAFVPISLLFVLTAVASQTSFVWKAVFIAEILGLGVALAGHLMKNHPGVAAKLLLPYYVLILNVACFFAFCKFVKGEKMIIWKPRTGN